MPNPSWIRAFNAKELYRLLVAVEDYHPPGPKTVQRWRRDEARMDPQDVDAVRRLLGVKKDPLPDWAEGLEKRVAATQAAVERLVAWLEEERAADVAAQEERARLLGDETPADPAARALDNGGRADELGQ